MSVKPGLIEQLRLDGELHAHGCRLSCDDTWFYMNGPDLLRDSHRLLIQCTDEERLEAHWDVFTARAGTRCN